MIAVLDASAAVELVRKQPLHRQIAAEIERARLVLAPELYISEVSNTFWKYSKLAQQQSSTESQLLDLALDLVDEYVSARELYREAFDLSCQWDHPVYDSLYLVLARRNGAVLLTIDKRLRELSVKNKVKLVSLK